MTVRDVLPKLKNKESLSSEEMSAVMESIMAGHSNDREIEDFLLALREKGESVAEIVSAARSMRQHGLHLSKNYPELLDTCGTGGDNQRTFNVSTLSALVACAAGAKIAKHGNRSVSSVCGSADLLEMLGVKIELSAAEVERSIDKTGFGFFFAPLYHPATRSAMAARKKIQGKTIFNVLGPLSNPAGAAHQLVGVYEERLVQVLAEALLKLGSQRAMVVHGKEGLDEISISGETLVAELSAGKIRSYTLKPEDIGFKRSALASLRCDSKDISLETAKQILGGVPGPKADIVYLNAGAALFVADKVPSIKEGAAMARETVISGSAQKKLEQIISL